MEGIVAGEGIDGVAGLVITSGQSKALASFYKDVLGFTPHSERPDGAQFKWGSLRLTIGSHSEVKGKARDPYRVMINLLVTDIHAVHRRLTERGVAFIRPPERERWGWLATFHDPDGNTLQLLQNNPR
ncbi:MAG: hypothetical protein FJ314_00610 [SAR202 cluster bacterium]|nr:hypothetical protein [SAR202 cluster bacterium]